MTDDREFYEERAAIYEYEAGMARHEAERRAREDMLKRINDREQHAPRPERD